MQNIREIIDIITKIDSQEELYKFFGEIFTTSELETLSKRWRILKALAQNSTQRNIAKEFNVSLCKVTRGAKILKDKNAITTIFLMKDKNND